MAKKSKQATASNSFATALDFCSLILKDKGLIHETHVSIKDNWISAFNGVLGISCRCDSDLVACPQARLASEALSRCKPISEITIGKLDNNRLSIKSTNFRAVIPCVSDTLINVPVPDLALSNVDDRLKDALSFAGELPNEEGNHVYNQSVLMSVSSVIASLGGTLLFEHWHGINSPTVVLPKATCVVLNKINKPLTRLGFSKHSITFYFEDESWLRSQLLSQEWPDVSRIFEAKGNLSPIPPNFYQAVKAVAPFGEGLIYAREGVLRSHAQEGTGAEFDLGVDVGSWCYPARQLAFLEPWATTVDFQAQGVNGKVLLAMGDNARAVIAGVKHG